MKKYNPIPAIILFWLVTIMAVLFLCTQAKAGGALIWFDAPSGGGAETGTWEQVADTPSPSGNYDNGDDWNERGLLTAAQTDAGGPWTKVRVTFYSNGARLSSSASICIQSSGGTCAAAPVELTVGSSSTFTIDNSSPLSDEADFSFDTDDNLLVIIYVPDGNSSDNFDGSYTQYWGQGSDDHLDQNVSYTTDSYQGLYTLVEGWNPD